MSKKLYVIDRNGRMHVIEIDETLTVNGENIKDADHLESVLSKIWSDRTDLYMKNSKRVKVFDTYQLIGYQIVPIEE